MADRHARATFDSWYARTGDLSEAARQAGISERTARRWRAAQPQPDPKDPPLPPSDAVGREEDLRALLARIRVRRWTTLTGPPGIGKTAIAIAAAHAWEKPARFVSLSGSDRDPAFPDRIASSPSGTLVVLDGAEAIAPRAAEIASAIPPGVRVLATARRALEIQGEEVCRVRALEPGPALALLSRRCPEISAPDLARLAPLLEGYPLAIELAAQRYRGIGAHALLLALQESPSSLSGTTPSNDPSHRSIDQAFSAPWGDTRAREREALSALALAEGMLDARDAAALSGLDPIGCVDVLDALHRAAWIERRGEQFFLYRAIRDFVRRRHPQATAALERHAAWATAPHLPQSVLDIDRIALLDRRRADLTAVARRAGQGELAAEDGLRAALALAPLLVIRGPVEELPGILQQVLAREGPSDLRSMAYEALSQALVHRGRAAEAKSAALEAIAEARSDPRLAGRARLVLGVVELVSWHIDEAVAEIERGLALARESGDHLGEARAYANLGAACYWRRDLAGARSWLGSALAAQRRADDRLGAASTLALLGAMHHREPDRELGRAYYDEAATIFAAFGDLRRAAAARAGAATLELEAGDLARARQGFDEALSNLERCGDRGARYRGIRGMVHHLSGREALARADYADALDGVRAARDLRHEALFLAASGLLDGSPALLDQAALLAEQIAEPALVSAVARLGGKRAAPLPEDAPPELRILQRLLSPDRAPLRIDEPRRRIETPGGIVVDLSRRRALWGVFERLLDARRSTPGRTLSIAELFEAGWPGQHIAASSASNRVHVALSTLRTAGLRSLLQSAGDGVRLDPEIPLAGPSEGELKRV